MRDLRRSPLFDIFINDIEMFGLLTGLRPVAKKEGPDADRLVDLSSELLLEDFYVLKNERTGCAYVSGDPGIVERLLEMENREFDGGSPQLRKQTVREIGITLGYPECCATSFGSYRTQDDRSVMASIISKAGNDQGTPIIRRIPWLLNFLPPMAGPVFWYPCDLRCRQSEKLAWKYLTEMNRLKPGAGDRMKKDLTGFVLMAGRWDFVMMYGTMSDDGVVHFDSWRCASDFHAVPEPSVDFRKFLDALPVNGRLWLDNGTALAADNGTSAHQAFFTPPTLRTDARENAPGPERILLVEYV